MNIIWCDKHGVPKSLFSEWKQAVIWVIDEKISHLSTKAATEKRRKKTSKLKDENNF